jgi:antagonist of KipI
MPIIFNKPGLFTTVQDLGRPGYRSLGITPGGAMDIFAATVANLLAGNDEHFPVIEMHFPGPEIQFTETAVISITGADFGLHIDDQPVACWQTLVIERNQTISFRKNIQGARAYLAIGGGLRLVPWLNSFSTNIPAVAGGYQGRPSRKSDRIELLHPTAKEPVKMLRAPQTAIEDVYNPGNGIRCIPGPEWDLLTQKSRQGFPGRQFTVTAQSDRMGYRLSGEGLFMAKDYSMVSSPVDFGTIQLLPNGQLIVLMADHQTTGGYPRIAGVITADLPRLAQQPIHSMFRFALTDPGTAAEAIFSMVELLGALRQQTNGNEHTN